MSPPFPYIIAEAGVNHNGSMELALALVDAAAEAGADAVKFQTFQASRLVSRTARKAAYQVATTGADDSQFAMLERLELDRDAHATLIAHCRARGIQFLSTPFDVESVALLAGEFDLPRLKVPSGEITNAPLLLAMARTGKPIIVSTGMCTLGEIEDALGVLAFGYTAAPDAPPSLAAFRVAFASDAGWRALVERVVVLHCTTEYPAPLDEVNLRAMRVIGEAFGLPVGYSDHTEGIAIPVAAAALGAVLIEKHFTLDRSLPGPDHRASLEPAELTAMVRGIRDVARALGTARKFPTPSESANIGAARKSLVAAGAIRRGELFTAENLTFKRPGTGLSPGAYWEQLGRPAARDYALDELIEK